MPLKIPVGRAHYYWIHGTNSATGNGVVLGPYRSEEEARDNAGNLGEPRFFKLTTRDSAKATKQIKAKIFKGQGIAKAMKRVGHSATGAASPSQQFEIDNEGDENDDDDI